MVAEKDNSEQIEWIGESIRTLRSQRKWSQKKLAEVANLPRSTIATIEAGGANPTIKVLLSIASALHIRIDELLSKPRANFEHFSAQEIRTEMRGRGRAVKIRKLLPHALPGMEIDRMDIPSGGRLPGVPHQRGTFEYLFCESGEITLYVAGEKSVLKKGDLVAFSGDQKHSYANESRYNAAAFSVVLFRGSSL